MQCSFHQTWPDKETDKERMIKNIMKTYKKCQKNGNTQLHFPFLLKKNKIK